MANPSPYYAAVDDFRRDFLMKALRRYGNKRRAAEALKISPSTVTRECQRLGIKFETRMTVEAQA